MTFLRWSDIPVNTLAVEKAKPSGRLPTCPYVLHLSSGFTFLCDEHDDDENTWPADAFDFASAEVEDPEVQVLAENVTTHAEARRVIAAFRRAPRS